MTLFKYVCDFQAYGVRSEDASKKWLEQATSIGSLAMFQSMLNPNMVRLYIYEIVVT